MHFLSIVCEFFLSVYGMRLSTDWVNIILALIQELYKSYLLHKLLKAECMTVFAGPVKIVRHSSCRTSAILKYICPLPTLINCYQSNCITICLSFITIASIQSGMDNERLISHLIS